ncbi:Crp/Fnr family transcriptional regulator [Runella rosea]|uniref:Crp/Fnr family transcriptional regulator n=1 Tax=Runella rosea TaxID=2259595 RepID=A0A344TPM4_9BACT|nr:cyclic nucleotide-binding domain-containing protein [Runella rosea]AXE20595.1 Crp/Fnr family transcriptional regulator [Runella rosea]
MSSASLYRSLGVRADEIRTVGLFFLHHFFLGFGTMLIYVSANVILLENHPESSLPLAYMASAVGMMIIGKVYTYFEHHLRLNQLVIRVLWAVIVLTAVILLLVIFGHSVTAAVAIMVGFRSIYLLTNLEFWGVSAVVFDVRQSKRLFGVISAGDMPAKALGGMLAVLIHGHTELIFMLFLAFGFFWAAMYTAVLTFRSHHVTTAHGTAAPIRRRPMPRLITQLFGGSELIFAMCLSLTAVAVMATGVEYAFFINVKYKLHSQAEVMTYLGGVLTLTYLLATFVKLVVSRQTIDYFGINKVLALLPVGGLGVAVSLGVIFLMGYDESVQLVAYCFVYLGFEVVRRALFDPVFLVLFQPLSPHQRLRGHTLAKGFYEPLGLGLGGLMLYLSHHWWQGGQWFLVEEIVVGAVFALWFLRRTYLQYVATLQEALGKRFVAAEDLAIPDEAVKAVLKNLRSDKPKEVINAVEWLSSTHAHGVPHTKLHDYITELFTHRDDQVRLAALEAVDKLGLELKTAQLRKLTAEDYSPLIREVAARIVSKNAPSIGNELLYRPDMAVRKGAILGLLSGEPNHSFALTALEAMRQNSNANSQLATLTIVRSLKLTRYVDFVKESFVHPDAEVVRAAIETSGVLPSAVLSAQLVDFLSEKNYWRLAAKSLASVEKEALPLLTERLTKITSPDLERRIVAVCAQMQSKEAYGLLLQLLQRPHVSVRTAALHALRNFDTSQEASLFEKLLQEELLLSQRLLHGQAEPIETDLKNSLMYEQEVTIQRIFGLLMQRYDPDLIASTQNSVLHSSRERRANSLELLENSVPRQVYGSLHALLDDVSDAEKINRIDVQMGVFSAKDSIKDYILQQGARHFTDWTIRLTLRGVSPAQLFNYPDLQLMSHSSATAKVSITERVMVLKNTDLFAETPENVLSSIAPIMKEVNYLEGQTIFEKGDLGTSMFVIYEGEVGIYDGQVQLATFSRGDVFGELALLDAEPRSAVVVSLSDVQLFRVDQADFYDLMDERGEVLRNIIRILCQRIRNQNTKLRMMATK